MKLGNLTIQEDILANICKRYGISELAVFGSVVEGKDKPNSDVDVLVSFFPESGVDSFDLALIRQDLSKLFGRSVDLVEKAALTNPYRKKRILVSARVIYAA